MYKNLLLDDIRCINFDRTIGQNPELATHVQSIAFDHSENYADHFADDILPKVPGVRRLRFFARGQDFYDRGFDEDENALGLGLWGVCLKSEYLLL
jgi:hypothetical protein